MDILYHIWRAGYTMIGGLDIRIFHIFFFLVDNILQTILSFECKRPKCLVQDLKSKKRKIFGLENGTEKQQQPPYE
jgi:hypothetical protein